MKRCIFFLCLSLSLLAILSAAPAHAQTEDDPTEWYGWKIAVADGLHLSMAAASVAVLALNDEEEGAIFHPLTVPLALGSVLTYTFGGPIVHLASGERRTAAYSLGLRLGVPAIAGVVGYAAYSEDPVGGAFGGVLVGGLIATAADIVWLSRRERPTGRQPTVMPVVSATDSSFGLGIATTF